MDVLEGWSLRKNSPPARIYFHKYGLEDVFGKNSVKEAKRYIKSLLGRNAHNLKIFNYIMAVVWGEKASNAKMVDFFGYSGTNEWPGNPGVSQWQMKDDIYVP